MKPRPSRVLASLVALCSVLGLGVAAAPAAQAAACGGAVSTSGLVGFGVTVESGAATICLDVAGVRRVVGVDNVREVAYVDDGFACPAPVSGTIGDPNDPPYLEYRIAVATEPVGQVTDPTEWLLVCVGAGSFSRTVAIVTTGRPTLVLYTPPGSAGESCGSGPAQEVEVALPGVGQSVYAGVGGGPNPLWSEYYCVGTRGLVECSLFASGPLAAGPSLCPAAAALVAEVSARVAEIVPLAGQVVGTVTGTVDAVLAEVRRVVDPLVAIAVEEATRALGTFQELLPVEVASNLGGCSVSVASVASPAIEVRRSPTGQVPASVCVVTASGVTRVTVG